MLPTERKPTVRSVRIADMKLSFIRRDALSARPVERQDADNGLLYNVITKEKEKRNCLYRMAIPLSFSIFPASLSHKEKVPYICPSNKNKSMKATSMYICLEGLKFFARHGVAPQETVVGANFTID